MKVKLSIPLYFLSCGVTLVAGENVLAEPVHPDVAARLKVLAEHGLAEFVSDVPAAPASTPAEPAAHVDDEGAPQPSGDADGTWRRKGKK